MDKSTFFDFIAFIVPGGTLLILFYTWMCFNFPQWGFKSSPDSFLWSIPLIFFAFVLGHLMGWLGKLIEARFYEKQRELYLQAWNDAKVLPFTFMFLSAEWKLDDFTQANNAFLKQVYERTENYLDVQDKNKLPVILQSQYSFFRNGMATSLVIAVFIAIVLLAHCIFGLELQGAIALYVAGLVVAISLILACGMLMNIRKQIMICRTFVSFDMLERSTTKDKAIH